MAQPVPRAKTTRLKQPHSGSAANRVRQKVLENGEHFWRLRDFPNMPPSAVATALSRLAREGVLERVRKGVYYRPRDTRFGQSLPTASAVAAQTLRAPVHPAGLTAANALGFTTQNPRRLEYATSAGDAPTALDAHVYTHRPTSRETLSPEEGALLEFLRDSARTSDLSPDQTIRRLRRLLAHQERFSRLVRAARDEPPRVRAMLGALGQELGADEKQLQQLRRNLNPLSRYNFGVLRKLRHSREWQAK